MGDEELIKMRKLLELERKMLRKKLLEEKREKETRVSPRELVEKYLTDRAKEVLEVAYRQYPVVAEYVVKQLAQLILAGKIKEKIDGVTLLTIFSELGYPVRMPMRIVVKKRDEVKPLAEFIKEKLREKS